MLSDDRPTLLLDVFIFHDHCDLGDFIKVWVVLEQLGFWDLHCLFFPKLLNQPFSLSLSLLFDGLESLKVLFLFEFLQIVQKQSVFL